MLPFWEYVYMLMSVKLFFSRFLALSVALMVLIFSCSYVAFSNEKARIQPDKHLQLSIIKGKQGPFSKKFLHRPRVVIGKRAALVGLIGFLILLFFLGFRSSVLSFNVNLDQVAVVNNRILWLRSWRI